VPAGVISTWVAALTHRHTHTRTHTHTHEPDPLTHPQTEKNHLSRHARPPPQSALHSPSCMHVTFSHRSRDRELLPPAQPPLRRRLPPPPPPPDKSHRSTPRRVPCWVALLLANVPRHKPPCRPLCVRRKVHGAGQGGETTHALSSLAASKATGCWQKLWRRCTSSHPRTALGRLPIPWYRCPSDAPAPLRRSTRIACPTTSFWRWANDSATSFHATHRPPSASFDRCLLPLSCDPWRLLLLLPRLRRAVRRRKTLPSVSFVRRTTKPAIRWRPFPASTGFTPIVWRRGSRTVRGALSATTLFFRDTVSTCTHAHTGKRFFRTTAVRSGPVAQRDCEITKTQSSQFVARAVAGNHFALRLDGVHSSHRRLRPGHE
jgi:hypothetical protein